MTRYDLLLFGHIAAATICDVAWRAPRLFIPASLSTLVLGVLVVLDGSWGFDEPWTVVGLAGWAASFLLGFFYFRPEGERIGALVEQHGPSHPEVDRRLRRLNVVDRIQLVILFVVIADMAAKPGSGDAGALLAGAAILALAVLTGAVALTRRGRAPADARPTSAA